MGRRLGLGALLVALRKVHGRRDEESGRASPHIVIESRREAHATLWILGFGSVQGLVQRSRRTCIRRCIVRGDVVATCLATREAFHSGLWC